MKIILNKLTGKEITSSLASAFVKLISSLRTITKSIIKQLVLNAWLYPIIFFQIILCVRFNSWTAYLCLLSGFITNILFNNTISGLNQCSRHSSIVKGFLGKFEKCSYQRHSLSEYLSEEGLAIAKRFSFNQIALERTRLSMTPDTLEEEIQIYTVKKGESGICPAQLVTYAIPSGRSYIFVRDEPGKIRGVGKFFVNHEVGHALWIASYHQFVLLYGNKTLLFLLFWIVGVIQWNFVSALTYVALFLTCITLLRTLKHRFSRMRLEDEVWADIFAISALSLEERRGVAKFFDRYPLPPDPDLDDSQNQLRAKLLKKNLTETSHEDIDPEGWKGLFNMKHASNSSLPLETSTAALLVSTLAMYSRPPSFLFFVLSLLLIALPLFALMFLSAAVNVRLRQEIRRITGSLWPGEPEREALVSSVSS